MRNRLGDGFAKSLQSALCLDKYLKVINVSGNKITDYGLKLIIKMALMENTSLIGFDARLNPGCTEKVERQISLCMLKNLERQLQKGLEVNKKFLHPRLYSFGIPQSITKALGLRHMHDKKRKSRSPSKRHASQASNILHTSQGASQANTSTGLATGSRSYMYGAGARRV